MSVRDQPRVISQAGENRPKLVADRTGAIDDNQIDEFPLVSSPSMGNRGSGRGSDFGSPQCGVDSQLG